MSRKKGRNPDDYRDLKPDGSENTIKTTLIVLQKKEAF